jgi:hypothetical protein
MAFTCPVANRDRTGCAFLVSGSHQFAESGSKDKTVGSLPLAGSQGFAAAKKSFSNFAPEYTALGIGPRPKVSRLLIPPGAWRVAQARG